MFGTIKKFFTKKPITVQPDPILYDADEIVDIIIWHSGNHPISVKFGDGRIVPLRKAIETIALETQQREYNYETKTN